MNRSAAASGTCAWNRARRASSHVRTSTLRTSSSLAQAQQLDDPSGGLFNRTVGDVEHRPTLPREEPARPRELLGDVLRVAVTRFTGLPVVLAPLTDHDQLL